MIISRKPLFSMLGSLALALAISGVAAAQTGMPKSGASSMGKMDSMHSDMKEMRHKMMGMHMMPATVTSADTKTGVVDVTAKGMSLKVHFPPSAIADLRAGDKITLHMGFSKP